MQRWNEAFKKEGRIFTEVQEDVPRITKLLKKRSAERVLDLGFGSGRHTVYLARNGFDVYGIDIADEGLRIAQAWLRKEHLKANLKLGNIYEKLPYDDYFFDAIISVQVLHHSRIENIRRLIKEMVRILKPKGLIFVTVLKGNNRPSNMIAPRTYVPLKGLDRGLVHYLFNESLLRKEFRSFSALRIWVDSTSHYCLLGESKG